MAKKRRPTANQLAFRKERDRIRKAYNRLLKQGYRFEQSLDQMYDLEMPSRVTKNTLDRMHRITPTVLRSKATALSEETGKPISGYEKFHEDARRRAKQAYQTYQSRKNTTTPKIETGTLDTQPDLTQRAQEAKEYNRKAQELLNNLEQADREREEREMEYDPGIPHEETYDIDSLPHFEDIVLDNIQDLIESYGTVGSNLLRQMLSDEIRQFGRKRVAKAISEMPEYYMDEAQNIMFYAPGTDTISEHRALKAMAELIKASCLTQKEKDAIMDAAEEDAWWEEPY